MPVPYSFFEEGWIGFSSLSVVTFFFFFLVSLYCMRGTIVESIILFCAFSVRHQSRKTNAEEKKNARLLCSRRIIVEMFYYGLSFFCLLCIFVSFLL